ncbi:MAG: phosphohydrolase [Planctomycetes bacterium RBG_13_60_9]|nr:MAG: phosphohydrolase [Planctomycetes bacterium RBG_13_60_9]
MDTDERYVLDCPEVQRLRHIHQLALTYLVYPGATHRRFEHSLGVMELATRVFDVITAPNNIHDKARHIVPPDDQLRYWRRVLRMAGLCHDLGHLPFSHAAEKTLLPKDWDHERMTQDIIGSDGMKRCAWDKLTIPLKIDDIIKVALGPRNARGLTFNEWETILSEIISGDVFGVDRMDYLLRDSLHTGVGYGRFDHYRLIDTLCILPKGGSEGDSEEPMLGLDAGGLRSAEALLWARYFMFSQVYCHPIRRVYDIHLRDFLENWLPDRLFPTDVEKYLAVTDNDVIVGMNKAALEPSKPAHIHAKRILERKHFGLLYEANPADQDINLNAAEQVYKAACTEFGPDQVRRDSYTQKGGSQSFPVRLKDGRIAQSVELSDTLAKMPVVAVDYVFLDKDRLPTAEKWLDQKRNQIIAAQKGLD